jgi:hypothetical protein
MLQDIGNAESSAFKLWSRKRGEARLSRATLYRSLALSEWLRLFLRREQHRLEVTISAAVKMRLDCGQRLLPLHHFRNNTENPTVYEAHSPPPRQGTETHAKRRGLVITTRRVKLARRCRRAAGRSASLVVPRPQTGPTYATSRLVKSTRSPIANGMAQPCLLSVEGWRGGDTQWPTNNSHCFETLGDLV